MAQAAAELVHEIGSKCLSEYAESLDKGLEKFDFGMGTPYGVIQGAPPSDKWREFDESVEENADGKEMELQTFADATETKLFPKRFGGNNGGYAYDENASLDADAIETCFLRTLS